MADPKYAGLPGIVYDQADVYETSDLPESEQEFHDAYSELVDSNPSIEVLHLSAKESFEKFKEKSLNTNEVDFSDNIYKKYRRGYLSKPIEWSIGERGDETVVEKFTRLQCETNELLQEVQQLKGSIEHGKGTVSPADLFKNIEELKNTLSGLNLEEILGKQMVSSVADPDVALQRKLLSLANSLKKAEPVPKEKKGASKVSSDSGAVSYELFYAPEHAKLSTSAQMAEIEKKMDKIEKTVGSDPEQISNLSSWTNHKGLLGTVRALSRRLALLEPAHLDHIEGRLHSVHTRMNSIAEKKSALEDAEKQNKIDELFELVKKNEMMSPLLPEVVDRLSTLETLHHEANQFNSSLKHLDAAQGQLLTTLDSNSSLLKAVQEKLGGDLNAVQESVKAVDERLKNLPKQKK